MEITEQQFTANLEQMPEEAQIQVVQIIEANEPPALQAFAMSLGVTLSLSEEEAPMAEDPMAEALMPEDPMAEAPVPEAPVPEEAASPMQDQMQQLALGDQVAGMIDQPGAEDQTGVADDVPMNAREGAVIVSAAAIARVGKRDFEKRIIEPAIKYLEETEGIVIDKATITRPAQQVKGGQKILVSNKEYHIPPELVEVIGSDLLEKINKRGEPETEKKLEEQGQQEQQQAAPPGRGQAPVRAAKGGKIDPKESAKKKLRMRENAPLEQSTGKLFSTAEFNKKANGKAEDFRTIGFGHAIQDTGKSIQRFQKLFTDAKGKPISRATAVDIASGKKQITKDQALKLFDSDYKIKEDDVIRRVRGKDAYSALPPEVQEVFVDANFRGDFQSGGRLRKWVKHAVNGEYAAASMEVLDHAEARANPKGGVAKRIEDYSKILKSLSPNNSPPEGRTTLEEENSFMSPNGETKVSPIPTEKELQELEKGASTTTYFTEPAATR